MIKLKLGGRGICLLLASAALVLTNAAQAANHTVTAPQPAPPVAAPTQPLRVFVAQNGQQTGPFDGAGLSAMAQNGTLTATTLVWQQGMADWAPAASLPALQALLPRATTPFPPLPPQPNPQTTPAPNPAPNPAPQPAFDAAAYIVGTWDSEPATIAIEGVGQGTLVGTTTYNADRSLTLFATIDTPTAYGLLRQTITGQGTYTAILSGEDSIQITPNVSLVTYTEGQTPVTGKLTTPYIAKVIDQNTVQNKDGNISRRR